MTGWNNREKGQYVIYRPDIKMYLFNINSLLYSPYITMAKAFSSHYRALKYIMDNDESILKNHTIINYKGELKLCL